MTKKKVGQPLMFEDIDKMKEDIEQFFLDCKKNEEPYTITGLALALGTTRKTLIEYEGREEYVNTIKMAKARCEQYAEKALFSGRNAAGPIFALKNYGWKDKSETVNKTDTEMTITINRETKK